MLVAKQVALALLAQKTGNAQTPLNHMAPSFYKRQETAISLVEHTIA
jgi:hypothetical protein